MPVTKSYAATAAEKPIAPFQIERREVGPKDIQIEIMFCGVCHSDLHTARNEWQNTIYPVVVGHEIVGRVTKVGAEVASFKVGDMAGVGCMVDSCRVCDSCKAGLENYCESEQGFTGTYNAPDRKTGELTQGGYSERIVVDQRFVLRIPENLDLAGVAPLLCAGITTYSPLRHWKVGKGQKVGVVGLGGLGHMAIKLAHAFGAQVILFTTSRGKSEDGKRFGADEVIVSKDEQQMAKHITSFDLIIDTASAKHDPNAYINLLKRDGTYVQVGAPPEAVISPFSVIFKRRQYAGSLIGGIPETQEMLDFCGQHGITSDVEIIPIQKINEAYERMLRSDVKYRFVIDMKSLQDSAT
ncbi:MAG: NAD(P)-dependent alcohol dehydrogenase [Acidobacteriaceae bacterium]